MKDEVEFLPELGEEGDPTGALEIKTSCGSIWVILGDESLDKESETTVTKLIEEAK